MKSTSLVAVLVNVVSGLHTLPVASESAPSDPHRLLDLLLHVSLLGIRLSIKTIDDQYLYTCLGIGKISVKLKDIFFSLPKGRSLPTIVHYTVFNRYWTVYDNVV